MSVSDFAAIDTALDGGPAAAVDALVASLTVAGDYDRLFDALLMRARLELGLSVVRPASFDDVPAEQTAAFEAAYVAAARRVGQLHLDAGHIPRAWVYFRTLREPQPVAEALAALDPATLAPEDVNAIVEVALHEGANRLAGLQIMLASHGTCNTVSMTDQVLPMLAPEDRRSAAAMLVRDITKSLVEALRHDIQAQPHLSEPQESPADSTVAGLIDGRPSLFDDANYHVDVSHLHSVVRFARALTPADPELSQAMELAQYGAKLAPQFQYVAEPPFDDYYPASIAYFQAVGDTDRSRGLDYFRTALAAAEDDRDWQVVAYVLVDLLLRCEQVDAAAEVAAEHLSALEEAGGLSFAALCRRANRFDLLKEAAQRRGDLVAYTAAQIEGVREKR